MLGAFLAARACPECSFARYATAWDPVIELMTAHVRSSSQTHGVSLKARRVPKTPRAQESPDWLGGHRVAGGAPSGQEVEHPERRLATGKAPSFIGNSWMDHQFSNYVRF